MKQLFLFLLASLLYIGGASAQSSNIPLKQGPKGAHLIINNGKIMN